MFKAIPARIETNFQIDDYQFRFCNFFDDDSKHFEDQLIKKQTVIKHVVTDEEGNDHLIKWPKITFWQSHRYITKSENPFFVLQMSNTRTQRHYQVLVQVEVSKINFFKQGIVRRWAMSVDQDSLADQLILLEQLKILCFQKTDLMTLKIQPYVPGDIALSQAIKIATLTGFRRCAPTTYEKSRFVNLQNDIKDTFQLISPRKRTQLRIKSEDQFSINKINDTSAIPSLQKALHQSYQRSVGGSSTFNFLSLFSVSEEYPEDVIKLGFCLNDAPTTPKAFVFGLNHQEVFEYSVGGSESDPNLRKYPFNLLLIWQLILEAKKSGCHFFDLGGITKGDSGDPLSGISNFKRNFPGFELSVGHEMKVELRPNRLKIYQFIQNLVFFSRRIL